MEIKKIRNRKIKPILPPTGKYCRTSSSISEIFGTRRSISFLIRFIFSLMNAFLLPKYNDHIT